MQQLNHPFVVRLLGVARRENVSVKDGIDLSSCDGFLLTEHCNAGSLKTALTSRSISTEPASLFRYVSQSLSGLTFIHAEGFSHNSLSADAYRVKVADGSVTVMLSDFISAGAGLYVRVESVSFRWHAPEVLETGKSLAFKSDVFSWASTAAEILEQGKDPFFWLESSEEVIAAIKGSTRPRQPKRCSDELYKLLLRCWEHDPEQRVALASVAEAVAALPEAEADED
jgi:serine/threonine protein kinase